MFLFVVLLSLIKEVKSRQCSSGEAKCPTFQGIQPVSVFDAKNDKIFCFWSESVHYDVGSVEIVGAQPISYQSWSKVNNFEALPSFILKTLEDDTQYHVCEGSEECCFDDQLNTETINEIEMLEQTLRIGAPPVKMTPPAGDLQVGFGKYNVSGFVCGADTAEVLVWFPFHLNKGGPYPFIVFGHGLGSGIARDLCKSIASLGFVVVAPKDFQQFCPTYIDDFHTIDVSKANPQLHKSLSHVNWESTGIVGHSMGGNQAVKAGTSVHKDNKYNLKAIVASHGANDPTGMEIPALFETSIYDRNISPAKIKGAFEACPSRPKVFLNAADGGHMEPTKEAYANPWMAHFFGCHVGGLDDSCKKVYGDGPDSMCQDKNLNQCIVVKD